MDSGTDAPCPCVCIRVESKDWLVHGVLGERHTGLALALALFDPHPSPRDVVWTSAEEEFAVLCKCITGEAFPIRFLTISLHDTDVLVLGETLGDVEADASLLLYLLAEFALDIDGLLIIGNWSMSPMLGDKLEVRETRPEVAEPIPPMGLVLNPASVGSGLRGGVTCTFVLIGDVECHTKRDGLPAWYLKSTVDDPLDDHVNGADTSSWFNLEISERVEGSPRISSKSS